MLSRLKSHISHRCEIISVYGHPLKLQEVGASLQQYLSVRNRQIEVFVAGDFNLMQDKWFISPRLPPATRTSAPYGRHDTHPTALSFRLPLYRKSSLQFFVSSKKRLHVDSLWSDGGLVPSAMRALARLAVAVEASTPCRTQCSRR